MVEVVKLFPGQPTSVEPRDDVIQALSSHFKDAVTGEIRGILIISIMQDGRLGVGQAGEGGMMLLAGCTLASQQLTADLITKRDAAT